MEWKKDVTVTGKKGTGYIIHQGEKKRSVAEEYSYLMEVIQKGIRDDQELIAYIMKEQKLEHTPSSFELAGFLIEYADFLAEDTSHYEVIPD